MFKSDSQNGFTLIEILIVVVIVSILTVMGVQMIASGSIERNLKQHSQILQATIEYACDQATLQNIPYGVIFSENGYLFSQFVNQEWLDVVNNDVTFVKVLEDGSLFSLRIEGQEVVLTDEFGEIPQLLCNSTGELSAFELVLSDATMQHQYQLKTVDFWSIEGQWMNEEKK